MITLPFPVSTNQYYRCVNGRVLISAKGRKYRHLVAQAIVWQNVRCYGTQRLSVSILMYPPDKRRRDLDNFCGKALLDAMQHALIYDDDSQIDELKITRGPPSKDARVEIPLLEIGT